MHIKSYCLENPKHVTIWNGWSRRYEQCNCRFPPRKSILEYEKMHAELVTSTYIPKYLKLLHHLVEHPLLIGVIDSREIFYLFHEIVGVSAAIEVEV